MQSLPEIKRRELHNSLYEASLPSIPKPAKDNTKDKTHTHKCFYQLFSQQPPHWKHPRRASMGKLLNRSQSVNATDHSLAMKRNQLVIHTPMWINLQRLRWVRNSQLQSATPSDSVGVERSWMESRWGVSRSSRPEAGLGGGGCVGVYKTAQRAYGEGVSCSLRAVVDTQTCAHDSIP